MPQEITNDNYLILWNNLGSDPKCPNSFGLKVTSIGDKDSKDDYGPLYQYASTEGRYHMEYRSLNKPGYLSCSDGCCYAKWPGDISESEHEKALLAIVIRLLESGLPLKLILQEFNKIPVFREMSVRRPDEVLLHWFG